jgi:enamidase
MKRAELRFVWVAAAVSLGGTTAGAQPAESNLSEAVRAYVSVDAPVVALTDVTVIDGTGTPAVSGRTLILRDGLIEWVGPAAKRAVPEGAEVLGLEGHTVLPGLIMLHEHMFYPSGEATYNQMERSFPRLYLAGGATTIRTAGSRDPYGDLNLKAAIDAGQVPGPLMDVTGPYVNGPGLPILFVNKLEGPEDAAALVDYWADEGVTSFKAYMHISRAELAAALEVAHARGLKVTGHLCSVTYAEAAGLGIDNLEHGFLEATDFVAGKEPDDCPKGGTKALLETDLDGPEVQALFRTLIEHGVAVTSTLPVFETYTPGRPSAPPGALDAMAPDARDRYLRTWAQVAQKNDAEATALFEKNLRMEKAFADAGGLLVAGTDPTGYGGVVAGYSNHRQVELLVEAGFTPEEAIEVCTLNGARYLEIDDRTGSIAAGKAADLMVVEGHPATDIADLRKTRIIFKAGVGYDSQALFESVKGTVGIR